MMYQCGRCGLTRASGQEMGVITQCKCPWEFVPPVAPQRTWVGLTGDEIYELWPKELTLFQFQDIAHAIEAKLEEKNA